jgi:hypothetical protein
VKLIGGGVATGRHKDFRFVARGIAHVKIRNSDVPDKVKIRNSAMCRIKRPAMCRIKRDPVIYF